MRHLRSYLMGGAWALYIALWVVCAYLQFPTQTALMIVPTFVLVVIEGCY